MAKLWGGRFKGQTNELMERFNASISFDQRLYKADVLGSQAYARALVGAGVLTAAECQEIVKGLDKVLEELDSQDFSFAATDEDIHTAVERRLGELVGPVAGKLHTGRSRNDQVATDTRLYLLEQIDRLHSLLVNTQRACADQADVHLGVMMAGYTHLQPAQPVLFSHWLMSYFWMLQRDRERLQDVRKRTAVLPLGASALAGNAFPIDCHALAQELGFIDVAQNSIDAVSDRDFVAEFLFWATMLETHLSRLAEDLILWSNPSFGLVEVDEGFTTGSSIMPQKRNPDALELLRGKTGRLLGHLVSLLTTLKGLPSAYDKDLQEDKEPLFDAIDTLSLALPIATSVIATLEIHADKMEQGLDDSMLATELADYLVSKGVPFRESHRLVGEVVRLVADQGSSSASEKTASLTKLSLETYRSIDERFGADLYDVLDPRYAISRRNVPCGTSLSAVRAQIDKARKLVEGH